jgi:2-haloacid dehalogenase
MSRTLVFDAYGTLFDVHSVRTRCDALWPGKGAQLSQLWRAKQLEYTWQRSLMKRYEPFSQVTLDALEHACAALRLPLDAEKTELLMKEYLQLALYPDVKEALARLRGSKLAILSNGSPDMLEPLLAQSGLSLDAVLSVHPLQVYKPAPQVYQFACDRLGVAARDIEFVSSNCWDALGAKSFGFRAYWVNRSGATLDRLGFVPDRMLQGLDQL